LTLADTKPLNLFLTGTRALSSWGDINGMFCICESHDEVAEATCYPTQYLNCTMSRSITSAKCNVPSRRKRSADGSYKDEKELDRLLQLMASSEHNTLDIKLRTKVIAFMLFSLMNMHTSIYLIRSALCTILIFTFQIVITPYSDKFVCTCLIFNSLFHSFVRPYILIT
jgi:hypothetical protein